jgi:ABC-type branched-subunit amino acid transport system substrate-binding protein
MVTMIKGALKRSVIVLTLGGLIAGACGGSDSARREVQAKQSSNGESAAAPALPQGSTVPEEAVTADAGAAIADPSAVTSPDAAATATAAPSASSKSASGARTSSGAAASGKTPAVGGGTAAAGGSTAAAPSQGASPAPGAPGTPLPGTPTAPAPGGGGANTASDVGVSETSIKVGHIGILSGPVASVGDDISWAGQAVLQATNDAGGINGRKLDVKVRDDAWDGTKGINAAKDLVEREKIFAFCCTMTVATTDPLATYTDQVKVPNVAPDGWGEAQYGHPWAWPAGNSSTVEGYVMAEYAIKQQQAKTAAILYFDNPSGRAYRDGYKKYFEQLGGKILVEQAGTFDDPGTATFVAKSRAANVDLTTFMGEPGLWVKFVREAASQGYKPPLGFQGCAAVYFDEIPGLAGPWAEGTISTTHWTPNDIGEAKGQSDPNYFKYKQLVEKYYPKIHHATWTKAGYSGGNLFVETVRKLGANVTRARLKDELDKTTVFDLGLGAKVDYWKPSNRGNHTIYLLKLAKDANAPKEGGGMRFKYFAGPFQDPVNKPDGGTILK